MQPRPTQPPHIDVQKQIGHTNARARKDSQRRRRDCPNDCRDSRTSYPRARRSAHRCARRRVSTAPVTDSERLRASLADSDRPQHPPVRVNRTACESALREAQPAQLQKFEGQVRFNFEKSQQHLGGADYTRTAAVRCCVYASLAPAQPPPPAGLASGLTCTIEARIVENLT